MAIGEGGTLVHHMRGQHFHIFLLALSMAFDPSKLFVGSAGFAYDWLITREWKRLLLLAFPIYVAGAVFGTVFLTSRTNKAALAQWYLELGNEEIAEWEDSWAPAPLVEGESESDEGAADPEAVDLIEDAPQTGSPEERPKVSPFAQTLFKRVQMLNPGDRSQYIIGATLAQQGAVAQAEQLLTQIAPNEGVGGYAPAHLILAEIYSQLAPRDFAKYKPLILRHLAQATRWDRMPMQTLQKTVQLYANEGNIKAALNFQATAADRDPAKNIGLARLAVRDENPKLAERARRKAEEHLLGKLEDDSQDLESRLQLATLYMDLGKFSDVQKSLFDGVQIELTPEFTRARSQFYISKYERSFQQNGTQSTIEIGLLDVAMKLDPTNPSVAEHVARLASIGGVELSKELEDKLREMLATGQATAATHSVLAEAFLSRGRLKDAIPHLDQAVARMGSHPQLLNNLAYCLAKVDPDRIDDAIMSAKRAVQSAKLVPDIEQADRAEFVETLSLALEVAGKDVEAVTAIENAIELQPNNPLYHESAARLYRKASNDAMASIHERLAKKLTKQQSEQTADGSEASPEPQP